MIKQSIAIGRHHHAHEAVIANEYWYGDGPPLLRSSFSAANTAKRQIEIVDLLLKAAQKSKTNDDWQQSRQFQKLANKIDHCRRGDRCGSLACPLCARAFQRAKTAAQQELIKHCAKKSPPAPNSSKHPADVDSKPAAKILIMATVIPLQLQYRPQDLGKLVIPKRNRWLKDVLTKAGLVQMMVGSADIGWEQRRGKRYYQLHWHLAMWTDDTASLQKQLLRCFPPKNRYDRPVQISKPYSSNFLPYLNKAIKLPELLRQNRKDLPQLLLALDCTAPLDLMVICGLRLSAQAGRLALRPFGHGDEKAN
jgi:hypothetical protein